MNKRKNAKDLNSKILITGASGFIGNSLFRQLGKYSPLGIQSKPRSVNNFITIDLQNENMVEALFKTIQPEIIFHFAALTSPKKNEQDPKLAYESHVKITENILNNISSDTPVVFLSTDKVFDGSDSCPTENAKTNPQCVYGKLKLQCEEMIISRLRKFHIIRIPIAHALGEIASPSFIDKALVELKAGEKIEVFRNVYRCFVTLSELLNLLEATINDTNYGIYHIGSKLMSYSDRIQQICEQQGIDWQDKLLLKDGHVTPMVQNLNTEKIKKIFGMIAG